MIIYKLFIYLKKIIPNNLPVLFLNLCLLFFRLKAMKLYSNLKMSASNQITLYKILIALKKKVHSTW